MNKAKDKTDGPLVLLNEITNRGLKYRSTIICVRAVSFVTSVKEYVLFGVREKEVEQKSRSERCLLTIYRGYLAHYQCQPNNSAPFFTPFTIK